MNIESYKKCSSAISLQGREKSVRKSSIRASDEYIKPSSYNPYQENTKILNNDKQQQGLSQQYKNLNKQINNNPDNNQHLANTA